MESFLDFSSNKARQTRKYWKLKDHSDCSKFTLFALLAFKGRQAEKSASKPELLQLIAHADKSLPHYAGCTREELYGFAVSRGLLQRTKNRFSRHTNWVKTLLEGDQNTTFSRFRELPAELRNRIYECYIDGFSYNPDTIYPPPLARSSKQMLAEVGPVYYDRAVFALTIGKCIYTDTVRPNPMSRRFLRALEDSPDIPALPRLQICAGYVDECELDNEEYFLIHTELLIETSKYALSETAKYRIEARETPRYHLYRETLEPKLHVVVGWVTRRAPKGLHYLEIKEVLDCLVGFFEVHD